jgi:hypothetical protein
VSLDAITSGSNTFVSTPAGPLPQGTLSLGGFFNSLCEKNRVLVEYALGGNTKPIGVAEWDTKLTHALPEELQARLPTIEQIEQVEPELSREENEG